MFEVIKSNSTEYHCASLIAWNDGSASQCIKTPKACDLVALTGSEGRKRKQGRNALDIAARVMSAS